MSKQTINLGTPPTGSTGDTTRTAFEKTGLNFDEIYSAAGSAANGKLLNSLTPVVADRVPMFSGPSAMVLKAVQSSNTDATAGALMGVTAFGLGSIGNGPLSTNLNNETRTGWVRCENSTSNLPVASQGVGDVCLTTAWDANAGTQLYFDYGTEAGGAVFFRAKNGGTWGAWTRLASSGLNNNNLALNTGGATISVGTGVLNLAAGGVFTNGWIRPSTDNTHTLGAPANRWSQVYAGTGTINTSDAREKTPVRSLTPDEVEASKALAKELGAYSFLSAAAAKGDDAREHIGMTVQRAIEVLEAHGLDPLNYGFICHDAWDSWTSYENDEDGNPTIETTHPAGDRYGFRMDELLAFIAVGFEDRLAALESAI